MHMDVTYMLFMQPTLEDVLQWVSAGGSVSKSFHFQPVNLFIEHELKGFIQTGVELD